MEKPRIPYFSRSELKHAETKKGGKYLCRREVRDFLPLVICNHPPSLELHNQQVERLNLHLWFRCQL